MSMFEDGHYRWRETYFVLFDSGNRPKLETVERALSALNEHYLLRNLSADEEGRFDSLTLLSSEDFAALDICYLDGEEVLEQGAILADEMETPACRSDERAKLKRIRKCDGRFDVLHFEQVIKFQEEEESEEMLDPTALLVVLDRLVELTDGIAVDPQAGTLL